MGYLNWDYPVFLSLVICLYIVGFLCACSAVLRSRTPQGATAWVMSLLFLPLLAVPLFVVFGRSKFQGYNFRRKINDRRVLDKFDSMKTLDELVLTSSEEMQLINATISNKNQPGFTKNNALKLLVNATEAYPEMLKALEGAQHYIIFQFYIFRPDDTGRMFVDLLIKKSRQGVRVSFLHDEIGAKVPKAWNQELLAAGVKVGPFNTSTGRRKMQVNFRNHRKIVIVDGKVAFVGGINIGDDYLGLWPQWGPWRDTHLKIEGPAVIATQLAAAKDWHWSQESEIDVDWQVHPSQGDSNLFVMHTGPADDRHSCLLAHIALINAARERLWIANAYFVPPESLLDAIFMASLRGVDVRLLIPAYSDSKTVLKASQVYLERLLHHNVKVFRYTEGFLHQKVMVVDEAFSVVGSANFDCRSMFINFEIMAISADQHFNQEVAHMLDSDFKLSRPVSLAEFENDNLIDKIICRGANLMAPIL